MIVFTPAIVSALFKAGMMFSPEAVAIPAAQAMPVAVAAAPAPQKAAPKQATPQTAEPQIQPVAQPKAPPRGEILPEPQPRVERAAAPQQGTPAVTPAPKAVTKGALSSDEIISKVKTELARVSSAKGRFVQTGPDGSIATGTYAIQRPGRVRFDYDDPSPLLIVSDRTTLAFIDSDLETTERVPLLNSPLSVVLSDKPDFDGRAQITRAEAITDLAFVTVVDPEGEFEGEVTLVFDTSTWELLRWTTLDALGALTSVELIDTETGVKHDPRLFRIEDVRDVRERDDRR